MEHTKAIAAIVRAALGIPTLDGLGAVGEGAHAANESILVDRIADRTALLAGLISREY